MLNCWYTNILSMYANASIYIINEAKSFNGLLTMKIKNNLQMLKGPNRKIKVS